MTLLSTRIQALQMVYVDIYQTLKQEFPTKVCIIPKLSRQYNNFASTEDKNNFKWDVKKLRESTDKYRNMLKDKINFANSEQWDGVCEGLLCTMMRDVYAVYMKAAEKKKKKVQETSNINNDTVVDEAAILKEKIAQKYREKFTIKIQGHREPERVQPEKIVSEDKLPQYKHLLQQIEFTIDTSSILTRQLNFNTDDHNNTPESVPDDVGRRYLSPPKQENIESKPPIR